MKNLSGISLAVYDSFFMENLEPQRPSPLKRRLMAPALAVVGCILSIAAAVLACFPWVGVLGLAGAFGALLCLLSIPWCSNRWRILAVVGMLAGVGATIGGVFWIGSLSNMGGHVF